MAEPVSVPDELRAVRARVLVDTPAVRVTVVPVGWIAVRPPHREWGGPWALRLPAVLASRRWAPWMPVTVVTIEDQDGTVLVDTGEAVDQPAGHFGCGSAVQEAIYRRHLRIPVAGGEDSPARLRQAGVDPRSVRTVVLTHLHSDHVGNLGAFPSAEIVLGDGARGAPGAVSCRLHGHLVRAPQLRDGPFGVFTTSHALGRAADVRVVPLPGHTPGHLGVAVQHEGRLTVAAGDAGFDVDQLRRGAASAVVHDLSANQRTQRALCQVLDAGGQVLLSHDLGQLRAEVQPG